MSKALVLFPWNNLNHTKSIMGGSETESNDMMEVDDNKVVNGSTVGDLEVSSCSSVLKAVRTKDNSSTALIGITCREDYGSHPHSLIHNQQHKKLESDNSYHACSSDALSLDEERIPVARSPRFVVDNSAFYRNYHITSSDKDNFDFEGSDSTDVSCDIDIETVGDMNSNPDFDELDGTMTGTGYSRPVSACDDLFVSAHRIHPAERDREWRDYTSSRHFIDEDAVSPTSIYARNRGNPMNEPHRGLYAPFNIEAHNNMLRATDPAAYEYMMSFPKLSPEIQRSFDAFMRIIKEPIVSNGRPWIGPRINASSTKKLCEPSICESDFSGGECSFSGVSNANEFNSSMEFPVEDVNIGMQSLLDTTESRVNKELADKLLFASQNKIDASNTRLSSITYIPASIGLRWSRVITNLKQCASSHASQVEDIIQRIGQLQRISVIIEDYNKEYPCNLSSHSEDMKRRNTTTLPTTKKLRLTGEISHGFSGDVMNLENYTDGAEQICASLDYQVTDAIARESRRVIDMGGSISSDMYTVVDALISNEKVSDFELMRIRSLAEHISNEVRFKDILECILKKIDDLTRLKKMVILLREENAVMNCK